MKLIENIAQLATCRAEGGQSEVHAVADAAMVWEGDTIRWVGPRRELPAEYQGAERLDAGGRLVVPGLVDCHTHLAFGGWRADEFTQRIEGAGYLEIARAGGGIARTVRLTREAGEEALYRRARAFVREMVALGVTTIECKSGYGLDREHELKLLRVYRRLAESEPVGIVPTFLGAHVVPPEYRERREAYVALLVDQLIPEVAARRLATYCDVFVEESAFSVEEGRRILLAGQAAGLASRLHADQLTSCGGAELAAEVGALSADHLEQVSDRGIAAMAESGVVAVSLPIASLYLGSTAMPARRLIGAGVGVAVATDFNPGSAPSYHLPFAMTLACTLQRMTPAESLKGATFFAAKALGLEQRVGSLEAGKAADIALMDAPDLQTWLYHLRPNACLLTVARGRIVWQAPDRRESGELA
ncbi:MAG: imidazolonepropionase [Gemmatimonadales bacterium]|nr:imidazolonepropionase [Gemmatimonadales bacterium]